MAGPNELAPSREKDVADVVVEAASRGETLEIAGSRTLRGIGQPFAADRVLSSRNLSGITQYDPAELVLTARAGTPLSEIEETLSGHGQMLAFEPGDWRGLFGSNGTPTVGAVAASNRSGPRRIAAGAARDALLGVRFINGKGELVKNGGRVMKNVTGLDLVKPLAGSWGTLGFLTEVSLKVLPRPETHRTLAIHGISDEHSATLMATAMGTSAEVTGAAHLPDSVTGRVLGGALAGRPATVLRFEGFDKSVTARVERVKALLPEDVETSLLEEEASGRLWREIADIAPFASDTSKPLWKISAAPTAGPAVTRNILRQCEGEALFDWQGGLVWLQLADADEPAARIVRQAVLDNGGGHATLMRAADEVRRSVPVFQPQPPVIAALSERVRAAFDPHRVFNPGRMVFDAPRKAA